MFLRNLNKNNQFLVGIEQKPLLNNGDCIPNFQPYNCRLLYQEKQKTKVKEKSAWVSIAN